MPATEYTAHLIADAAAGGTAYQGLATVYLALATTTPTKTVAGTEITADDYDRKTFAQSGWTNDGAGNLENTAEVAWVLIETEDYEDEVVAVEAYDDPTAGNRLWFILLTSPRLFVIGETPKFLAGDLVLDFV
jgi:hypothetical protein